MSALGLKVIDEAAHQTNIWVNAVNDAIGWDHKQRAYRLLRGVLHVLRDHLSVDEAAQFGAQLPVLIRGIYYEGWNPSKTPVKTRKADEFIAQLQRHCAAPQSRRAPHSVRDRLPRRRPKRSIPPRPLPGQ